MRRKLEKLEATNIWLDFSISESTPSGQYCLLGEFEREKLKWKKMGLKKEVGPYGILIGIWRCFGKRGIDLLTNFLTWFGEVTRCHRSGGKVRESLCLRINETIKIVSWEIKLISHTMKPLEWAIEQWLTRSVKISGNQLGFRKINCGGYSYYETTNGELAG